MDISSKLKLLRKLDSENEIVEFKEAKRNFDFNTIGKYFSALSNEANLGFKDSAWLVFGIEDNNHDIVGTGYRNNKDNLQKLKKEIADKTTNRISFQNIYEENTEQGRVVLFQIPPAPKGIPIARNGHYYARDHESLVPLNIDKIERIRQQSTFEDRSAKICKEATIQDLDGEAIKKAREMYLNKHPEKKGEIEEWDIATFLNKAKVTKRGQITNTAILLLGKPESEHFISPSVSKISRILKDRDGVEIDYKHFSCPLLFSVGDIYKKIRNLKYRYIADDTLFPEEVDKYEPYIIREALNNCIAHQDYTLASKINVIENEDTLIFTNKGSFIPGNIENVINSDSPSEYYRNRFLADAMINFKMIDTIGSGIKKMFVAQKNKFFPLPEYEITSDKVSVTIMGKVLDMNYARKLALAPGLSLSDIMLLDKVQKKKKLTDKEIHYLRKNGFVEGRKSNLYISLHIAKSTDQKGEYIKQRGFKDDHYKKMILEYINQYGSATKKDIDKLLFDILPKVLDEDQKKNKIRNIIYSMSKRDKIIINKGSSRYPQWKKV